MSGEAIFLCHDTHHYLIKGHVLPLMACSSSPMQHHLGDAKEKTQLAAFSCESLLCFASTELVIPTKHRSQAKSHTHKSECA